MNVKQKNSKFVKNKIAMKKTVIILSVILINSCAVQKNLKSQENPSRELPEKEYFLISENEYDLTYLYHIDEPWFDELTRNYRPSEKSGFLLIYYTETRRKNPNDKYGGYTSHILHITPVSKGRFRIESLTDYVSMYIDFEKRIPDPDFKFEQTYQWDFAGYSDDTDNEAVRVLKYWYKTKREKGRDWIQLYLPYYME